MIDKRINILDKRIMKRKVPCFHLLLISSITISLLLPIRTVHSTVMVKVPLEEMVRNADHIVHGEVDEIRYERDQDTKDIYTYVSILVKESFKGTPLPFGKIYLKIKGGVLKDENIGLKIPGSPTFEKREEVIVFARKRKDGSYNTVGMAQGKYRVYYDEDRQEKMVTSEDDDTFYIERDKETGEWKSINSSSPEVFTLVEFLEKLRTLAEEGD